MQHKTLRRIFILIPLLATGFTLIQLLVGEDNWARSERFDWPGSAANAPQSAPPNITEATLMISNGTVIDGTGAEPIQDGAILIRSNEIVAVGAAADFVASPTIDVIDAAGGTIMPGIINAHVHNSHPAGTRHRFLTRGVTATCDMATSLTDMAQFEQNGSEQSQPAARGFKSGPMITAPGGYPSSYGFRWEYEVATPAGAQEAVLKLASLGADMIKIALEPWRPQEPWPVLTPEQTQAIVETARRYELPVRAHIQQAGMLDVALQTGVDVIEHTPLPFQEEIKLQQLQPGEVLSLADYAQLDSQLRRTAEQGVALVPTLSAGTCATRGFPSLETQERRAMCEFQLEIVGRFHQLGGIVALGNDYGNPGVERGMPLREMELLLEAGLSPLEVIVAGTRHAARVCGHGNELGTLEPGKLADIIIVARNPLADIKALEEVRLVIKDGQVVHISEAL